MALRIANKYPIDTKPRVAVGVRLPFSEPYVFSSTYTTQDQLKSNILGLLDADGIRIGLEDNLYFTDKVKTTKKWPEYNSTDQIIKSIQENKFPPIALFNFHPQRWTNNKYVWVSEFVRQNIKNKIKQYLFVTKNKS